MEKKRNHVGGPNLLRAESMRIFVGLWKVEVTPKVKRSIYGVLKNALPVKINLPRFLVILFALCSAPE